VAVTGIVVTTGMLAIGAIGAWNVGSTWLHPVLTGVFCGLLVAGA
jgi:hypothetical protein